MPIEINEGGGMTITGDEIHLYAILASRKALELEVKTDLRFSPGRNPLKACRGWLEAFGVAPKRTRKDVLEQMNNLISQITEGVLDEGGGE